MRNLIPSRICGCFRYGVSRKIRFSSTLCSNVQFILPPRPQDSCFRCIRNRFSITCFPPNPSLYYVPFSSLRCLPDDSTNLDTRVDDDSNGEVEPIDIWEEEDEAEAKIGDGGDGGGIVIENCMWGDKALSLVRESLHEFDKDMKLYAFRTSPRGYIYVRLDKLANPYGCPSMEEIESFSRLYKQKLDDLGSKGEIPDDLALEVSSPGADRLLQIPDDLLRFKEMPMIVIYSDYSDKACPEKKGIYFLDSIDTELKHCIWKLADVRENRNPAAKGRPLSRKQIEHQLRIPFNMIKQNF